MPIEISGKLIQKLNKTEGVSKASGKPWSKQEFLIETQEQYPRKVVISTMNEKVTELERFNVNDMVNVAVNIESREYNGRWYTDVRAWRIQSQGGNNGGGYEQNTGGQQMESTTFTSGDSASDDLPF